MKPVIHYNTKPLALKYVAATFKHLLVQPIISEILFNFILDFSGKCQKIVCFFKVFFLVLGNLTFRNLHDFYLPATLKGKIQRNLGLRLRFRYY